MKVSNECVVAIHYTLTNERGEELDSSRAAEPLTYLHGAENLIPGLERELEGRQAGDALKATIQPADAYGEVDANLIQDVPLEALADIESLEVGMRLESRAPNGEVQVLTVESIDAETAKLNANHALAGEVLHFDVDVQSVRAATEEELEHGHVHG